MAVEKFTIGGIGAGVVGTILASHLADAGAEIIITDLPHRTEQIDKNGLQVRWGEKHLSHSVRTTPTIASLVASGPDVIFISTKTWVLNNILPEVEKCINDNILVISVQNGIGTEDVLAKFIPPHNVARMVVNYAGANRPEGYTTVNWFNPPNYVGLIADREEPRLTLLVEMLNTTGLTTKLVTPMEIKKQAFLKTILNSALMPVCGVLGLTMKEAMSCKIIRGYAEDLVREGLAVAARLGYHYGENCLENCLEYLDRGGNHYPSMWVDLENKLPTEIDFLNGKIMALGWMFSDLRLTTNRVFVSLVVAREIKNGTRSAADIPYYISARHV